MAEVRYDVVGLIASLAHSIFAVHGWTWHDDDHPPMYGQIRDMLMTTLETLDDDTITLESGRFVVSRHKDEMGGPDRYSVAIKLWEGEE